ncbi:MAG: SPFH domain-containing protein [bacterium]
MSTASFIIIALVVFAVIIVFKGVKIVPQSRSMIIERLGKFHSQLQTGVNIIIPLLDKAQSIDEIIVTIHSGRKLYRSRKQSLIDLREKVYDFPRQNVITKDNVSIEIDAVIYFQVVDAVRAVYEIQNLPQAIEKLAKTTLRNIIGEMDLDETLSSRDKINSKLTEIMDEATDKWGVKVSRVELQNIDPPQDIKDAMEKQMRAERDRRAKILEAEGRKRSDILKSEGEKQRRINEAEGQKQSDILHAEGEAQARIRVAEAEASAIKQITEAISDSSSDPTQYLIAVRYINAFKEISQKNNNKLVYMPYEASGVLSSVGAIKEMFKHSGTTVDTPNPMQ